MYLGLASVYLGVAVAGQSVWALILLPVVLIVIQRGSIEPEEASGKAFWRELCQLQGEGPAMVIKAVFEDHSRVKVRTRSVEEF
jgi:hypothetical protein